MQGGVPLCTLLENSLFEDSRQGTILRLRSGQALGRADKSVVIDIPSGL
jgi:hypothetical protein